jgi:hypothetical protein
MLRFILFLKLFSLLKFEADSLQHTLYSKHSILDNFSFA